MVCNAIVYHVHNYCYIPVVEYMIIMSASQTPKLLSDRNEYYEDLSLETSDLVSVLKVN